MNKAQKDREENKEKFLEVIDLAAGNISVSCKKIGISRKTYYRWMDEDEDFRNKVNEINEALLDMAETMLMKGIKDGKTTEIIFYLKTKGRERGYVERQELDHTTKGKELNLLPDLSKLSYEQLEKLAEGFDPTSED